MTAAIVRVSACATMGRIPGQRREVLRPEGHVVQPQRAVGLVEVHLQPGDLAGEQRRAVARCRGRRRGTGRSRSAPLLAAASSESASVAASTTGGCVFGIARTGGEAAGQRCGGAAVPVLLVCRRPARAGGRAGRSIQAVATPLTSPKKGKKREPLRLSMGKWSRSEKTMRPAELSLRGAEESTVSESSNQHASNAESVRTGGPLAGVVDRWIKEARVLRVTGALSAPI